ncbi:MAG: hypothetical protein EOM12_10775 [Verrucomicrobiae bacterium]|nr:hypothetical protein [Verrucomicrobiae bacterium]
MNWIHRHLVALIALVIAISSFFFYDWKRPSLALSAFVLSIIAAVIRRKDARPWTEELTMGATIVALLSNIFI